MRRWLRLLADLWDRARRERSTPRQIGFSVAVGVFAGCTPFIGLHFWIALAAATLLRLNRLWAALASRISSTPLLLALTFGEIELGHRLRTGAWVALSRHDALARGKELFADWLLGAALVGSTLAIVLGLVAYFVARRWQAAGAVAGDADRAPLPPRANTPSAPRPQSSESAPSRPPAPIH